MKIASRTLRERARGHLAHTDKHIRAWPRRTRAAIRRPEVLVLGLIVLLGVALRLYFVEQWRPALVGFPDTTIYVTDARAGIFGDPLHVGGYSEFLRLLHGIRPHLSFVILVQHLTGLASGLLLFGAVRRARLPAGLGLVPAAVVILGGSELLVEHAALSEALFIFLVDLSLYALVRVWTGHWVWAILAGLALGTATDVRTIGLVLLPVLVAVILLVLTGTWRMRLLRGALVLLAAALPIGGYLREHKKDTGYGGFTGAGYFDLYARVAPFADCSTFHPPAGTGQLCVHIPRPQRQGHDFWEFLAASPAVQIFGEPDDNAPQPGENSKLLAFARAAILGQPLDYLQAVGRDMVRVVDPSYFSSPYNTNAGYGNTPEILANYYFDTTNLANIQRVLGEYYPGDGEIHKNVSFLRGYERDTRLEGPFMALLLLLALAAPILTAGEDRRTALLFLLAALTLLVAPIFASEYDYRFTIPAFGPLVATSAIGAWAATARVRKLIDRRRMHERRVVPRSPLR